MLESRRKKAKEKEKDIEIINSRKDQCKVIVISCPQNVLLNFVAANGLCLNPQSTNRVAIDRTIEKAVAELGKLGNFFHSCDAWKTRRLFRSCDAVINSMLITHPTDTLLKTLQNQRSVSSALVSFYIQQLTRGRFSSKEVDFQSI